MEWQNLLTDQLNEAGSQRLNELHELMSKNTAILSAAPINLDELSSNIKLRERLLAEQEEIEGRFGPLEELYETLAAFEVSIDEKERVQLSEVFVTSNCARLNGAAMSQKDYLICIIHASSLQSADLGSIPYHD